MDCIITAEDKKKATDFANKNWFNFERSNNRRTEKEIKSDIEEGKLGEICFEKIMEDYLILPNPSNLELWYDFLAIDGRTVDVKTTTSRKSYQERVYLPELFKKNGDVRPWADVFCLMYLDEDNDKAYYKGSLTKNDILDKKLLKSCNVHEGAHYVDKKLFVKK